MKINLLISIIIVFLVSCSDTGGKKGLLLAALLGNNQSPNGSDATQNSTGSESATSTAGSSSSENSGSVASGENNQSPTPITNVTSRNPTNNGTTPPTLPDSDVTSVPAHSPNPSSPQNNQGGSDDNQTGTGNGTSRGSIYSHDGYEVHTLAFEDSYPQAGDGDYNDYVLTIKTKTENDASGKIKKINGIYQLVANGSGFNEILNIRFPVVTGASFRHKVFTTNGTVHKPETYSVVTASQLKNGLEILPESKISIKGRNVSKGEHYQPGLKAEIEIIFDIPVEISQIGNSPFDVYLVNANKKAEEIHRFGTDYTNAKGYPAVLTIPGFWKWQYEGTSLYKENKSGYNQFLAWVGSKGKQDQEWYLHITDATKVYPVPEADIAGYLMGAPMENFVWIVIGMSIVGISIGFFFKRQLIQS